MILLLKNKLQSADRSCTTYCSPTSKVMGFIERSYSGLKCSFLPGVLIGIKLHVRSVRVNSLFTSNPGKFCIDCIVLLPFCVPSSTVIVIERVSAQVLTTCCDMKWQTCSNNPSKTFQMSLSAIVCVSNIKRLHFSNHVDASLDTLLSSWNKHSKHPKNCAAKKFTCPADRTSFFLAESGDFKVNANAAAGSFVFIWGAESKAEWGL